MILHIVTIFYKKANKQRIHTNQATLYCTTQQQHHGKNVKI